MRATTELEGDLGRMTTIQPRKRRNHNRKSRPIAKRSMSPNPGISSSKRSKIGNPMSS